MPQCIVCSNDSLKTRGLLPRVVYHSFPKNPLRKNAWLRAIGIDHCYNWQRICSDHFSIEDYRPRVKKRILFRNVIPRPSNPKFVENCLPYSYATQSNNNQIDNNKCIPIRQNQLRKERIKNAVVNYFESPRRSSRQIKLTTTDENMIYENMPRIRTDLFETQISTVTKVDVPVSKSTKDYTLGKGTRCSVKNCFNRRSKYLSLFAYPSDFVLRKKWLEKCGLEVASAGDLKKSKRVCCVHFDSDCFKNLEKKNRLRPGSVPSLFLVDDIIKPRNIPSTSLTGNSGSVLVNIPSCSSSNYVANVNTSSTVNCGSTHVNKPSCSSSNYVTKVNSRSTDNSGSVHVNDPCFLSSNYAANVNTSSTDNCGSTRVNKPSCSSSNYVAHMDNGEIIPLLVYIDSTTRKTKDFEPCCCVSGCITNNDDDADEVTLFAPPMECVKKWSSSLGLQLTVNSILCERHFRPQDILYPELLVNGKNKTVKSLVPDCLPVPMNDQLSTKKINNVPGCTNDPTKFNDLFPNDSYVHQKLKRIITNNSISVELEPANNSKEMKTPLDLFSKMSTKNSLSITLQPKPKQNLSSTANNISSSVNLTHSLPSTSSSFVARQSNTHDSNSDYSTNTSQRISIIDDGNTKHFEKKGDKLIFELSKRVEFPSLFWHCAHHRERNETIFYQLNSFGTIVKEIFFCNSLLPIVKIYNKKYYMKTPITMQNQLQHLIKKIDDIEKCSGMNNEYPTSRNTSLTLKPYELIINMKPCQ